jgi:hypothetical protein
MNLLVPERGHRTMVGWALKLMDGTQIFFNFNSPSGVAKRDLRSTQFTDTAVKVIKIENRIPFATAPNFI